MTSTAERWTRRLTRVAWQGWPGSMADTSRRQREAHARATTIVRAFYGLNLLWIISAAAGWTTLRDSTVLNAAWPASWIPNDDPRTGITIVVTAVGVTSLWAAVAPQQRLARLAFAICLLEYMAVVNGFGKIVHNLHAMLYLSFALVLLPKAGWRRNSTVAARQQYLTVVWCAQTLLLFAYGMTGLWKVLFGVYDLLSGRGSVFGFDGFSVILANRLNATAEVTLFGDAVIDAPLVGWALFVGTMYLETCSFLVISRPRLHRLWGFGLIGFHIGTQVSMGFTFVQNIGILFLFLVLSPQTVEPSTPREVIGDLPGILEARWVIRRLRGRGATSEGSPPTAEPASAPAV